MPKAKRRPRPKRIITRIEHWRTGDMLFQSDQEYDPARAASGYYSYMARGVERLCRRGLRKESIRIRFLY